MAAITHACILLVRAHRVVFTHPFSFCLYIFFFVPFFRSRRSSMSFLFFHTPQLEPNISPALRRNTVQTNDPSSLLVLVLRHETGYTDFGSRLFRAFLLRARIVVDSLRVRAVVRCAHRGGFGRRIRLEVRILAFRIIINLFSFHSFSLFYSIYSRSSPIALERLLRQTILCHALREFMH